jgi:DNA (cytosine-5)-methyltransferase 1
MIYGSVCSGIEAASVAWHPLGWRAAFLSEIEAFPRAVLTHHYPAVPLHGDFTTIRAGEYDPIDLLVGGTPCQSFSVAGLRGGLGDDRGNLALEYLRLADRLRPRWLVWENVPGVLSSSGGRDFGAILGGMVELGYGFAYGVRDAQYVRVDGMERAVPQRRRRVFVIGHLGDWRRAAAVLFERASLSGHPAPRREAGERVAGSLAASLGGSDENDAADGRLIPEIVPQAMSSKWSKGSSGPAGDEVANLIPVAHALRGEGFDASEDGTGRGTPLVPIAFQTRGSNVDTGQDVTGTLGSNADRASGSAPCIAFDTTQITNAANRSATKPGDPLAAGAHPPAIAFDARQSDVIQYGEKTGPLDTDPWTMAVQQGWAVRRLTPTECERLQGFPDGYTDVPYRGKSASDGPRYKALGNSMAVNVMRWIGRRIDLVDSIPSEAAE